MINVIHICLQSYFLSPLLEQILGEGKVFDHLACYNILTKIWLFPWIVPVFMLSDWDLLSIDKMSQFGQRILLLS